MAAEFAWISDAGHIPARWDLRLLGWRLIADDGLSPTARVFDGRADCRAGCWRTLTWPGRTIAVGVECADERAAMLGAGLADALPLAVAIGELAVRFARLGDREATLPRTRRAGPLLLDLFHRDARLGERWLALHPREFALLWRLAENRGARVGREALLSDVWRLRSRPETNSLEVHVSRLRAKLAVFGMAWMVETDRDGGYRLADGASAGAQGWTAPGQLRRVAAT